MDNLKLKAQNLKLRRENRRLLQDLRELHMSALDILKRIEELDKLDFAIQLANYESANIHEDCIKYGYEIVIQNQKKRRNEFLTNHRSKS